jgi:hypothetical protein
MHSKYGKIEHTCSNENRKTKKEVAKYTHVEVISVWVINHLNEIDYIRMIQHFHNKNLKGKSKHNYSLISLTLKHERAKSAYVINHLIYLTKEE